ncbi:Aste57867_13414 [Aphanomyces stellatus]|uniref:Aste57867_13414 protein n=1 Tax=Aphanomyces stellatus TaxID=120398 RepID=A0A485L051_9STRA|nr:hypothetical protein As57867_013364 [Aphanomyces stellatus]VFT90253.1 Aste57867_13414 [Aphanomyces stellatus]
MKGSLHKSRMEDVPRNPVSTGVTRQAVVFTFPDILRTIASCQDGVYFDSSCLMNLDLPIEHAQDCRHVKSFDRYKWNSHATIEAIQMSLHTAFRSWLDAWGVDYLAQLFAYLPRMAGAAVRDAIWSHDLVLLQHLHGILDLSSIPGNLMDVAASTNDFAILEFLNQVGHRGCTSLAMQWACRHGNLSMVQFLHQHLGRRLAMNHRFLHYALVHDHMDVVEYLDAIGYVQLGGCAKYNFPYKQATNLEPVIKFLHSRNVVISVKATEAAAATGQLDLVQWILANTDAGCSYTALSDAIRNGHVAVVEYLTSHCRDQLQQPDRPNPFSKPEYATQVAAAGGHLDILKCLIAHNIDHGVGGGLEQAAAYGHLEMVQWLVANQIETCTADIANAAAETGHLVVLDWLYTHGGVTVDNPSVLVKAALNGDFDTVQWLCRHASSAVFSHGNIVSGNVLSAAIQSNRLDMVQWLHEHVSFVGRVDAMAAAAATGNKDMLLWLHAKYPETFSPEALSNAAGEGHLDVVKWLHEYGQKDCHQDILQRALSHQSVLKWLVANRTEGCRRCARRLAEMFEQFASARFLQSLPRSRQECSICCELEDDVFYDLPRDPCACFQTHRPWMTDYVMF